ncbi:hypothetical protein HDU98_012094 [Podochytrium sp. JEL0797]|nr:hypothetical protein HDU98_012094 [Podochytrium sp. JEL0797]
MANSPAINAIHRMWMAFTFIVLVGYGLYAGIIYPILAYAFPYFRTGFAHKSRVITTVMSAILGVGGMTALLVMSTHTFENDLSPMNVLNTFWYYCNYWEWSGLVDMSIWLFWFMFVFLVLFIIRGGIMAYLSNFEALPADRTTFASNKHAFVLVTHNSSDCIVTTVNAILKLVPANQIFLADNGSSKEEQDWMDNTYRELAPDINILHIKYGSKTLAQYAVMYDLYERFKAGTSPIEYITILDDDVLVPPNWPAESIEKQFDDVSKVALCYPLCADNKDDTICAAMQDIEYLSGDVGRCAYDVLGTQLFASGAIATWRVEALYEALSRHSTVFNGEDLELGLCVHRLSGRDKPKVGPADQRIRIGLVTDCLVPTTVPFHWMHSYDVLPLPIKKKLNPKPCPCGEHSLFNQRFRSWDPTADQFFPKLLVATFSKGDTFPLARYLTSWMMISVLREYLQTFGFVVAFCLVRSWAQFLGVVVFYVDAIFIWWALGSLFNAIYSAKLNKMGRAFRPDLSLWYSMHFAIPLSMMVRFIGVFFSLLFYVWFKPFPKSVREQMELDEEKRAVLQRIDPYVKLREPVVGAVGLGVAMGSEMEEVMVAHPSPSQSALTDPFDDSKEAEIVIDMK